MAFSAARVAVVSPTQLSVGKPSGVELKSRAVRQLHLQVRCKGDSELEAPKRLCVTRRDATVYLTTLSAIGIGISSPKIAEARITKDEIRRKIKEKLEMLRKKASLSKRKENDKEKLLPTPPSTEKENNLPLEPPPLPLPNPPQGFKKSLLEATSL